MQPIETPPFIEKVSEVFSYIITQTPALHIFFIAFFVFYLIISIILLYHWNAYGMKSQGIIVAETLYVFVSLALFFFASLALYYF